jgi:hypothetical protein
LGEVVWLTICSWKVCAPEVVKPVGAKRMDAAGFASVPGSSTTTPSNSSWASTMVGTCAVFARSARITIWNPDDEVGPLPP